MTDIGRLLLPPPSPPALGGRATLARVDGKAGREARDDESLTARVDTTAEAAGGPRGKHFRFRVLDGGRNDQLTGNAEVPARTDPDAENIQGQAAAIGPAAAGNRGSHGGVPLGTPLATFLAQLIAQEQLSPGLHDPPTKAADRAYRQAGAEPALHDGAPATSRFRMAV